MYDYFNNRSKSPVEKKKEDLTIKEPIIKKNPFPYKVRIIPAMLNCRSMPSADSSVNQVIIDQGIYNIIREKDGWGLIDTGAGWINLKFTEKLDK